MVDSELLQSEKKGFIVAPAGYGKTYLIAETVVNWGGERELILTHTHAGVDSIRRKILSLNPSKKNFQIETIDGFILRYVINYPCISNWQGKIDKINWLDVRACGVNLFKRDFVKKVLGNTYSGLYVDEYQDCCIEQHSIILELASVLPTRILGDPLQGIFDFGSNKIVDWDKDVKQNFKEVGTLDKPWRWVNANNNELGGWLDKVRNKILNGLGFSLNELPSCVKWVNANSDAATVQTCQGILSNISNAESIAVIGKAEQTGSTHNIASKLKGSYIVIEPIDSKDLTKFVEKFENNSPYKRCVAALDFATNCISKIKHLLKNEYNALKNKKLPVKRKPLSITQPLEQLVNRNDLESLLLLVENFLNINGGCLYREELYFDMIKILKEAVRTGNSLKDTMIKVRENKRRLGRRLPKRIVGRTVLIKGLEFDHVVILDADSFNEKNLYVALTRASKTVTIISNRSVLLSNDLIYDYNHI